MSRLPFRPALLGVLILLLGACSSQMDDIDTPVVRPPSNAPAGIYEGEQISSRTGARMPVTVLADGDGRMLAYNEDGTVIASGLYQINSRSLSWLARQFRRVIEIVEPEPPAEGEAPGEPEEVETTVVSTMEAIGSFEPETQLLLNYSTSDDDAGAYNLAYQALRYERRSDLPLLEGVWVVEDAFGAATASFSISQDGQLFGQTEDNCNFSGNFALIDLHYNLYRVNLTEQCGASNLRTTGLATLVVPRTGPMRIEIVTVSASTARLLSLVRS